jgi:hypothetical protein
MYGSNVAISKFIGSYALQLYNKEYYDLHLETFHVVNGA